MSQSLPYSAWAPRPTHAFTGGHTGSVLSICIVKSERWLVSGGSDGRIVIWDLETGCVVKTLKGKEGHTDSVLCVACDEKRIVSCSKGSVAIFSYLACVANADYLCR